ncbi:MAG: hypothetical protein Q4F06_10025 [Eubacteriales bacterium]|nr:hypothetical protein [Eubacteriales bacterium]
MFRLWCKLFDDSNHLLKDTVIKNPDTEINRTRKIFDGIKDACYEFDLSEPIWLDSNIQDFQRHSKVRFNKDNFIESIDFAYMEIQVIEED